MAVSHARDAQVSVPFLKNRLEKAAFRVVQQMIDRGLNAPPTSSVGRLFDAVASIIGLRDRVSYEGQAAMQLEWLATSQTAEGSYPFEIVVDPQSSTAPWQIDTRPMVRQIVADQASGIAASRIARRFHATIAEITAAVCLRIRDQTKLNHVVLSGGVFMNALLAADIEKLLLPSGFSLWQHRQVPANDGGISLGQLAVAAKQLSERT
jgi:hydrogenase maturation protein HypF